MEKLYGFFTLKIQQGEIRDVNVNVLSLNIFGIIFEAAVLWRLYNLNPEGDVNQYFRDFLDILLNGISSEA